ncbi:hypothetical protein LJ656_07295 [Paraburkholderia sp. MMS20-SJTR3]|uniref:Uncharacterized protein n=1 Tax=Paraburkholderia sejongensis TaxID=2886946 RepID=A0ABS8JR53_9BURK|nr:hypothetical protein [Paraburkholderia sp. MMS20-SJTR3]MCC8392390.1 hypothetical protein [Paraburkholderia sp. MMS20-SJTR3]
MSNLSPLFQIFLLQIILRTIQPLDAVACLYIHTIVLTFFVAGANDYNKTDDRAQVLRRKRAIVSRAVLAHCRLAGPSVSPPPAQRGTPRAKLTSMPCP